MRIAGTFDIQDETGRSLATGPFKDGAHVISFGRPSLGGVARIVLNAHLVPDPITESVTESASCGRSPQDERTDAIDSVLSIVRHLSAADRERVLIAVLATTGFPITLGMLER